MNTNTYVHKSSILLFNNVKEYNERELFKSYIESLKLKELITVLNDGNFYTECANYINQKHGVEMPDIQDERIKTLISELIKEKIDTNLKDIREESRQNVDEILNKYKKILNNMDLTTIPFNFNDDDANVLQEILIEQEKERPVERPVELPVEKPVELPSREKFISSEKYKNELQVQLNNLYNISSKNNNETFKQTILGNIENINNIDEDKKKGIEKLKDFLSLQSTKALDMNKIADYIITIGDPNIAEQLLTQPTPEFQIPVNTALDTVLAGPDSKIKTSSVVVNTGYGPKPTQNDRFGAAKAAKAAGAGAKADNEKEAGAAGTGAAGAAGEGGAGEAAKADKETGAAASPVASPLLADKTTLLQTLSHQMLKEKLKSINDGNSSPVSNDDSSSGSSSASSTSSSSGSSTSSSSGSSSASVSSRLSSGNNIGSAPSQYTDDSAQSSVSDDSEPSVSDYVPSISSSEDEDGVPVNDNNLGLNKFREFSQNFLREKLMSLKSEQRESLRTRKGHHSPEVYEDAEEEGASDASESENEGSVQKLSQKILQGKLTSLNIGEPASPQGSRPASSASSGSLTPSSVGLKPSPEANTQLNVWHQQLSQKILQEKLMSLASQNPLGSQLSSPAESRSSSPAGSRSGSPAESLQSEQITPQRGVKNSSDEPYLFKKYNDHRDEEYAIYYKDNNHNMDGNNGVNIANIKTDKCFNYFIYKKDDNIIIKPVKNYYSLTDILTIIYDEFQYIIIISKNTEKLYPGVLYQYKDYNKINLIFIYDNSEINIIYGNLFDDTTNTEDGSVHIIPIGDDEYHQIKYEIYPYGQDTKSLSNISSALLSFKIKSIQRTQ